MNGDQLVMVGCEGGPCEARRGRKVRPFVGRSRWQSEIKLPWEMEKLGYLSIEAENLDTAGIGMGLLEGVR